MSGSEAPWAPTVVANLTLPLLQAAATARAPPRADDRVGLRSTGEEFAPRRALVVRERRELDGWAAVVLEAA